jgi:hypothetical protein
VTLKGEHIAQDFQALLEDYVKKTYGEDRHAARTGEPAAHKPLNATH